MNLSPKPSSNTLLVLVLSCLVFACALTVVFYKHTGRQLFTQLQRLHEEENQIQMEWSQLLLEQGTWSADARLERVANQRMKMTLPEPNEVVVIRSTPEKE